MTLIIRLILIALFIHPAISSATTVHFRVVNDMRDEFLVVKQNIVDNVKSQFPGELVVINPNMYFNNYKEWTVEIPANTLADIQKACFLYELALKSTLLLAQANQAPEIGLSQYPSMKNESFHLYEISSQITKNVFDPAHNEILLQQYVEIHAIRYSSFIE